MPGSKRPSGPGSAACSCVPTTRRSGQRRPQEMSSAWIGERVSVVDYRRALAERDPRPRRCRLGAEQHVPLPQHGWNRRDLPAACVPARFASPTRPRADPRSTLSGRFSGSRTAAARSTTPWLRRCRWTGWSEHCQTAPSELMEAARTFRHSSVGVVGVGYERALADEKCWMYFPDSGVPFYRVTNFAKYAAANVPNADTARFSSYLTETAYRAPARAAARARGAGRCGPCQRRCRRGRSGHRRRCTRSTWSTPIRSRRSSRDRRARHDPALADGAGHLLAWPLRRLAVRDREHGPRREDGH